MSFLFLFYLFNVLMFTNSKFFWRERGKMDFNNWVLVEFLFTNKWIREKKVCFSICGGVYLAQEVM